MNGLFTPLRYDRPSLNPFHFFRKFYFAFLFVTFFACMECIACICMWTTHANMYMSSPFCFLPQMALCQKFAELQLAKTATLASLQTNGVKGTTMKKVTFCLWCSSVTALVVKIYASQEFCRKKKKKKDDNEIQHFRQSVSWLPHTHRYVYEYFCGISRSA